MSPLFDYWSLAARLGVRAEELGELPQDAAVREELQPPSLLRQRHHVLHELLETQERRERVRCALQEAGELLGEEDRELDPVYAPGVRDGSAGRIHDLELVLYPAGLRADAHPPR